MKRICCHVVVLLLICIGILHVPRVEAFQPIFIPIPFDEHPCGAENQGVTIFNRFNSLFDKSCPIVQPATFSVTPSLSAIASQHITRWEEMPRRAFTDDGLARVLVEFHAPDAAELLRVSSAIVSPVRDGLERSLVTQTIRDADTALANVVLTGGAAVLDHLAEKPHRVVRRYWMVPLLALDITPQSFHALRADARVKSIYPDELIPLPDFSVSHALHGSDGSSHATMLPRMSDTVSLVGADQAWAQGYTGQGWHVAVLDTGIRNTHEFFQDKEIVEACFSADAHCPNRQTSMTGRDAARHHAGSYSGYDHGTHVTGTAAGRKPDATLFGVARDADIIAVNVFTPFPAWRCDGTPCVRAYTSDIIAGMEYVYGLRSIKRIGALNLSLGNGEYFGFCDDRPEKQIIDALRAAHIPVTIASGNDGWCGRLGAPGCISSAITVMASDMSDAESRFNNWHLTAGDIFAPGTSIYSATGDSDSGYGVKDGTSMATPHVAGGLTLMRQFDPTLTVDDLFDRITEQGTSIATRCPPPHAGEKSRMYVHNFSDEIPLKRALNSELDWISGGDADWFGQSEESFHGGSSARTGGIAHQQRSHLHTRIVGPGILKFHWKVSSEAEHDRLRFGFAPNPFSLRITDSISGEVDWEEKSFRIPDGLHYLLWIYEKNDRIDAGEDAGWLDRVVWIPGDVHQGDLTVTLEPEAARDAGARWRRTGTTTWFESGDTDFPIPPGAYEVEFKPVVGWMTPDSQAVVLGSEESVSIAGRYVYGEQKGALTVTLEPQAARDAGARWRRVGTTTWHESGYTEYLIPPDDYEVEFKAVFGWVTPDTQAVTVIREETTFVTSSYSHDDMNAALVVDLEPDAARNAGAKWRKTGTTTWHESGYTEFPIPPGAYEVEFKPVVDWVTPDTQSVAIFRGEIVGLTGTYVFNGQHGSLTVHLEPEQARDAGAQWRRMHTDTWFESGTTESSIPPGEYDVEFQQIAGWKAPESPEVAITAGQHAALTGTYSEIPPTGSLVVTIEPTGAESAGARWRRTGVNAWRDSGTSESSIPAGWHTVEFKDVSGWTKPVNERVPITAGQTATLTATYTQGQQRVSLPGILMLLLDE